MLLFTIKCALLLLCSLFRIYPCCIIDCGGELPKCEENLTAPNFLCDECDHNSDELFLLLWNVTIEGDSIIGNVLFHLSDKPLEKTNELVRIDICSPDEEVIKSNKYTLVKALPTESGLQSNICNMFPGWDENKQNMSFVGIIGKMIHENWSLRDYCKDRQ